MKTYFEETLERAGLALGDYGSRITFLEFCGVIIEGHKGLYDYLPECVAVRVSSLVFTSSPLSFWYYNSTYLHVCQ